MSLHNEDFDAQLDAILNGDEPAGNRRDMLINRVLGFLSGERNGPVI